MKLAAIICEYNPLHNGHVEHIKYTKQTTACDGLVCVMSGNFVQRGEPAILDKYTRTLAALTCGADMVIELPTVFALGSADIFADGAVRIINSIEDMSILSFGSESGNLSELTQAAKNLEAESTEYKKTIKANLKKGFSYPKAQSSASNAVFGETFEKLISSPNNILAIEYIKALFRYNSAVTPFTLKRLGSGYNETELMGELDSATAIRKQVINGSWENINSMPDNAKALFADNYFDFSLVLQALSDICIFDIISSDPHRLKTIYDYTEGIEHRIINKAQSYHTLEELAANIKTKRYTLARLKRMLLYPALNITKNLMTAAKKCPPYINVLGVRKERKELLARLPDNMITRKKDIDNITDKGTLDMLKVNITADDLYCQITRRKKGMFFGQGMIVF